MPVCAKSLSVELSGLAPGHGFDFCTLGLLETGLWPGAHSLDHPAPVLHLLQGFSMAGFATYVLVKNRVSGTYF